MEKIVPTMEEYLLEGYNAKLPDELNAFKLLDSHLSDMKYHRREMPSAQPHIRRFLYFKDGSVIVVTVEYAGKDIYVINRDTKSEAKLNAETLPYFISKHIMQRA